MPTLVTGMHRVPSARISTAFRWWTSGAKSEHEPIPAGSIG